jgi:hypothetical protein
MWVPTTAAEVDQALAAETLPETLVFDGKEALPHSKDPRKSLDIATDVAAFANSNGGVLLYGVGEDKHKRLTRSTPIPLAGAAERVDQIVRTGVAETPVIEIRPLPLTPGAPDGYLAIIVPPSPRAPHMVVVDGEHRYYGRSATGNYRMGEAEVANLYERRARWAVDRDTLLRSAVDEATKTLWPRAPQLASLYVLVRPVISAPSLLDDGTATGDLRRTEALNALVTAAAKAYPQRFDPDLRAGMNWHRRGTSWKVGTSQARSQFIPARPTMADLEVLRTIVDLEIHPDGSALLFYARPTMADLEVLRTIVDLEIHPDGSALLFYGRAGEERPPADFHLFENLIAGLMTRTFAVLGGLYAAARYYASVDVGVAVVGLAGRAQVESGSVSGARVPISFTTDYYETDRVSAHELLIDPRGVARRLVLPLIQSTAPTYDPFT